MDKNWRARLRWSRAVRAELARRSPNGWQPTGPAWRLLIQRARTRPLRSSRRLNAPGGKAIAIQADAADADAVKAAVEKTVATFGRLDVLVNNAGTAIPKKFEETTLEEMDRVIDINIRGVFVATQAALKHMQDGGRIIMIGSCVGERMMTPGLVPYAATKGAVKMFTQGLCQGGGEPGHYGQQCPAGSHRHGFESRRG